MFKKKILIILSTLFCICVKASDLKEIINFGYNPGNLKLFSFNDSLAKNNAIVFVLHGCSETAEGIEEISDWKKLAVKNKFTLFYPQQKFINNTSLCFNWFLNGDINNNGECLSIYNMIRYAIDTLKVDSTNVFFYGVSAGACMAEVICANYPWLVNSAAVCSGIPFKTATGLKTLGLMGKAQIKTAEEWGNKVRAQNLSYKGPYPKIIVEHGTKDVVADFDYAEETIKQWTNVNSIKYEPTNISGSFENNEVIERRIYQSDKIKNAVIFYKINGMGHKLPVNIGNGEKQGGKDKFFSKNIGFFLTYYLAKDFGLIK